MKDGQIKLVDCSCKQSVHVIMTLFKGNMTSNVHCIVKGGTVKGTLRPGLMCLKADKNLKLIIILGG